MIFGVYDTRYSTEAYTDHPDQLPYKKIIDILKNEDPFLTADYHLLKEKLIVDDKKKERQEESRTNKIVRLHNERIKKNDYCFFLGDIQEGELKEGNDLLELSETIKSLNGKKILIYGNNDTQRWDFYVSCGFLFVTRSPIVTENYILSHEPIDIISMGVHSDYLAFNGHIHQYNTYYNMDDDRHINVYWESFGGPKRLSEYIDLYKNKKLPQSRSVYQ
jgi:calcineurin-like phosphoesterase family protein